MKNTILFVCLACLALSLSHCTKPAKAVSELTEICINPDSVERSVDISPLLEDSVDFIPLETTDECLLAQIERLTFHKGYYYISDNARRHVFVFDSKGRFVRKIGKQGGGPDEYSSIMFFDLVGDSLLIHDYGNKYHLYSLKTGEEVAHYAHKVRALSGFCLGKDLYLNTNYEKVDQENFNLCKLDVATGKVIDKLMPFDDKLAKFNTTGVMNGISRYKDTAYMICPYNDTIYQVTKDGVSPLYNIRFTARNLPDDIQPVNNDYIQAVYKGGYVKGFTSIQMTKDYIWGAYPDKGLYNFVCTNRHTLESIMANTFWVHKLGHLSASLMYAVDDDLVSALSSSYLLAALPSCLSKYAPTESRYRERLKELQKNLKDDNNPVLFRFRIKAVK